MTLTTNKATLTRRRYYLSNDASSKLDLLALKNNTTPSLMLESILGLYEVQTSTEKVLL